MKNLSDFIFENYPFFIWECEGNSVWYTIQILLKLFVLFLKFIDKNGEIFNNLLCAKSKKPLQAKVLSN